MGQYHLTVNLDKREYLMPHELGNGLKLWEQIGGDGGVTSALFALLAVSDGRGGGDLNDESEGDDRVVGRWGGDRIAVVGDYAEMDDLPAEFDAENIYSLCRGTDEQPEARKWLRERLERQGRNPDDADTMEFYRNITPLVRAFLAEALGLVYRGSGWLNVHQVDEKLTAMHYRMGLFPIVAAPKGYKDPPGAVARAEAAEKRRNLKWEKDAAARRPRMSMDIVVTPEGVETDVRT